MEHVREPMARPAPSLEAVLDRMNLTGEPEREERHLSEMFAAVGTFLGDAARADTVAKRALAGDTATAKILKGAVVGGTGAALELFAQGFRRIALEKIRDLLPSGDNVVNIATKLLSSSAVQEMLEDVAVYMAYKKGNKEMNYALPEVPKGYVAAAVGVDAAEAAVRSIAGRARGLPFDPQFDDGTLKISENEQYAPPQSFIGKTVNFSNPVTLFGAHEVYRGIKAYAGALRGIRQERASGGQGAVEQLVARSAKTRKMEGKEERLIKAMKEAFKEENGNDSEGRDRRGQRKHVRYGQRA